MTAGEGCILVADRMGVKEIIAAREADLSELKVPEKGADQAAGAAFGATSSRDLIVTTKF